MNKNNHKVPIFSDTHLLIVNTKIKRFYSGVIPQKDANRIANSEDPDQTALQAVCPHLSV